MFIHVSRIMMTPFDPRQQTHRRTIRTLAALITLFLGVGTASAQTGKITAKLVDAKTGEPLLHASIQIMETKQGAYSKENGVATIINVPPNERYTIVAKYVGY